MSSNSIVLQVIIEYIHKLIASAFPISTHQESGIIHAHHAKIAVVVVDAVPPASKALCADAKVFLIIAATLRRREQEIVPPATSGAIKPIQIS